MSENLDPRLNAYRDDLADARLEGRVAAKRFVTGEPGRIVSPLAPVRRRPADGAPLDTEALCGETVRVFETGECGWSWCQLGADSYVGYLPSETIGSASSSSGAPTHRVCAPRTLVFPEPDIKRPPLGDLPMGALVTVTGEAEDSNARYAAIAPNGSVVVQHLQSLPGQTDDFVSVAERFVGTPYLWGGKSVLGIDCSGLVQLSCMMAGIEAPRDTDMQERRLGTRVAGVEALRRGDLVFWKGHVGIMVDGVRLIHANAHHMMTEVEPLATTIERLDEKGSSVTSVRRCI